LGEHPGGHDNYPADRAAVRQVLRNFPEVRPIALANREFLQRAVRFLAAEAGIRQFIDIGTGIPSAGNVHEVAGRAVPENGRGLLLVETLSTRWGHFLHASRGKVVWSLLGRTRYDTPAGPGNPRTGA
jgi:S-adenosyl methyltransferase